MRRTTARLLCAGACAATFSTAGAKAQTTLAPTTSPTTAAASGTAIEEIVVTSQKRPTLLERTPEAVTALSGETLQSRGMGGLADLTAAVPNLSFTSNNGLTQIFIRGVGNNFNGAGGDPGVAFYANGIYISDPGATNISFFDTQRLEVLRGPQGGLYGRNATGGAIDVISAAPTDVFHADIDAVGGDYGRRETDGYVSGPLGVLDTDARLSFQYKHLDGFTKNELAAQPGAPDRLDDLDEAALRLQTLTQMPGNGTLHLIGEYYAEDDNGQDNKILRDPTPAPAELLFGAVPSSDPRSEKSQFAINKRYVLGFTAQYDQPLGVDTLTILGGYHHTRRTIGYDQDGTEASQATTLLSEHSDDYSAEIRLASPSSDRVRWLVGANYTDFIQESVSGVNGFAPLGFLVPGAPVTVPVAANFLTGGSLHSQSESIYGDVHFSLTQQITLEGNLRYTNDSKDANEFLVFGAETTGTERASWGDVAGKLGVDYQATTDLLIYADVARGFKAGAINLGAFTPPVQPETNTNYELGVKYGFWQRRGQLNLTFFHTDYRDMQIVRVGLLSSILANVPSAVTQGVEIEGVLKPIRNLTLNANFAYDDGTFGDFLTTDPRRGFATFDIGGNQLPQVSKTQFSLGAEYAHELSSDFRGSVRIDYAWRDSFFFTEFNTVDTRQGAYGTLALSATLTPIRGPWRVYAYVHNLTNETALSSLSIVSPLLGSPRDVDIIPPRNFGVGVEYKF